MRSVNLPIYTDFHMASYLNFRSGFTWGHSGLRLLPKDLEEVTSIPSGSFVILGGSRRPDLRLSEVADLIPPIIPSNWVKVLNLPGRVAPGRLRVGKIYIVN